MQYFSFLPEYKNKSLGVFSYMHFQWAMHMLNIYRVYKLTDLLVSAYK